ncbi:EAL domain-containing protein [Acholeplasma equifetale]|uniref:EAL domain-containing protein n=1 Tax=Acholeplasma equifetale TaxID=264634 RepID=UPI00047EDA86|nr:EAL domain-containing protein [Acholeplasma equifetale]
MNTLLTQTDQIIISIVILVVSCGLIWLFLILNKKEYKRYKNERYKYLNNIMKYPDFMKFLEHQIEIGKSNFTLGLISIDNFTQLRTYLTEESLSEYLNKIGKLIQMNLKVGWKFAQTKQRDTFIVYSPELYRDEELSTVADRFKNVVERRIFLQNQIPIDRTLTISFITIKENASLDKMLSQLFGTLFGAKKLGGNMVKNYDSNSVINSYDIERYIEIENSIYNQEFIFRYIPIQHEELERIVGLELEMEYKTSLRQIKHIEFLKTFESSQDVYWFSLWAIERAFEELKEAIDVYQELFIELPINSKLLEYDVFIQRLEALAHKYKIRPNQIQLNLLYINEHIQDIKVQKNILKLKNLNFKFVVTYLENIKLEDVKEYIDIERLKVSVEYHQLLNKIIDENGYKSLNLINIKDQNDYALVDQYPIPYVEGLFIGQKLLRDDLLPYMNKVKK